MLEHAKSQNELYWQEFQETEENYVPVPPEVGDKMKHYKLNQLFADEAGSMEIPQFMIETGRSLFSEHVQQPLSKENLYAGFSLLDKDTVIDFDSVDSEIARIDIDDSDAILFSFGRTSYPLLYGAPNTGYSPCFMFEHTTF